MLIKKEGIYKMLDGFRRKLPWKEVDCSKKEKFEDGVVKTAVVFNGDPNNFHMFDHDISTKDFHLFFTQSIVSNPKFKNKYLCDKFFVSFIEKNVRKIKENWLIDIPLQSGILNWRNYSFVYEIKQIGDTEYKYFTIYTYYKEFFLVGALSQGWITKEGLKGSKYLGINKDKIEDKFNKEDATPFTKVVLSLLFFLEFAEVETHYIDSSEKSNKKIKIAGEKYLNESGFSAQVINSNYFTNIIRTTGFDVEGHFRWQTCGTNHSRRELIWISDFKKNGYRRDAKILTN